MNNKFDELTKIMAQSGTRRAALRKFGVGLAGMALACFGLVNSARAGKGIGTCEDCIKICMAGGGSSTKYCREGMCALPCKRIL
jgi:hypothetical protein